MTPPTVKPTRPHRAGSRDRLIGTPISPVSPRAALRIPVGRRPSGLSSAARRKTSIPRSGRYAGSRQRTDRTAAGRPLRAEFRRPEAAAVTTHHGSAETAPLPPRPHLDFSARWHAHETTTHHSLTTPRVRIVICSRLSGSATVGDRGRSPVRFHRGIEADRGQAVSQRRSRHSRSASHRRRVPGGANEGFSHQCRGLPCPRVHPESSSA